jgi:hypothetical protein
MENENRNQVQVVNGGISLETNETAATAVATQARAMVEARYVLAMKNPRDLDQVRQSMLKECTRPRFAEVAMYHKPIGKGIDGPSIRFAEMALRCMRNVNIMTLTVLDDRQKRIVKVCVNDVEANVEYSQDVTVTKTVERNSKNNDSVVVGERLNSYGKKVYIIEATDDDILNKQNALISKAVRTLGLRVVPGDIVDECMDKIVEIREADVKTDPDAAKRKVFDSFAEIGVSVDNLKEYLGSDGSNLTPKELTTLRALFTAIKDGETSWAEAMDAQGKKKLSPEAPKTAQTLRQQYETLKLQMSAAGKKKELDGLLKGHGEESKRDEKTWNDADLQFLISNMERDLGK